MNTSLAVYPHIKVNILFFPIVAASILGNYFGLFAASFISAILHELTHIAVAKRLGIGISYMEIMPFGVCAKLKSDIIKNPWHEILVAVCGPLSNLLICATLYLMPFECSLKNYIINCNIAMAVLNLMPCLPLDGGRCARAFLTIAFGSLTAYNITIRISRIFIAFILAISVYALLTSSFNFSLILIGCFLLGNLISEQKNISRQAFWEIMNTENKLDKNEFSGARVITAHKSTLHAKFFDTFHITATT